MLRDLIRNAYSEAVALSKAPAELKRALKTHERVPRFLDNLERELALATNVSRETIINTTYDLTNLFISCLMKKADQDHMSQLAKIEAERKLDRVKEFDKAAETGIVTEGFLENE